MAALDIRRLEAWVAAFPQVRVLVIGDVILDEHVWGEVERVSPEAPVPVVRVARESLALGGAGNVVRNVIALGGECAFCSVAGADRAGRVIIDLLKDLGVDPAGVVVEEERPTSHKTRVIARSQHVVRFDRETETGISQRAARRLLRAVDGALPTVAGVILEDYGKGLLAQGVLATLMRRLRGAQRLVAVDPKTQLAAYKGAALFKPNLREAEQLSGLRIRSRVDLDRAVARMQRRVGPADFVVTRGAEGMVLYTGAGPGIEVHTAAREVFDVQGAGDTTIAALVLARLAGASLLEAAVISNAAAGVVVGKVGTATASPEELCALLPVAVAAAEGI